MTKPRKPTQVAPNQRPHFSRSRTASTHHKIPPAQANAGKLFRVRDKDWVKVWDENLSYDEAQTLKERVVAQGQSRTARVEPMSVEPPEWYTKVDKEEPRIVDLDEAPPPTFAVEHDGGTVVNYEVGVEHTMDGPGIVSTVPDGAELLVNGEPQRLLPTLLEANDRVEVAAIDRDVMGDVGDHVLDGLLAGADVSDDDIDEAERRANKGGKAG